MDVILGNLFLIVFAFISPPLCFLDLCILVLMLSCFYFNSSVFLAVGLGRILFNLDLVYLDIFQFLSYVFGYSLCR